MKIAVALPVLCAGLMLSSPVWAVDAAFTTLTSLHNNGDEVGEGTEDQPKGWPPANTPLGVPLLTEASSSPYLLLPAAGARGSVSGGLVRTPNVAAHYQVEQPVSALGLASVPTTVTRADGSTFQTSSDYRVLGHYVQRQDGAVIGLLAPPSARIQGLSPGNPQSSSFSLDVLLDGEAEGGALYRLDSDGTHPVLLADSIGVLHVPIGHLLHDPASDIVYGIDEGPDGDGRIFRLHPDDSVDILHTFANQTGRPQMPNGLLIGDDGMLYGLLGYNRGMPFHPDTLIDATTPVGAVYRLDLAAPADGIHILHTFTLEQGEINVANPARYRWHFGGSGFTRDVAGNETGVMPPVLSHIVAGPDGWLYGGTSVGQCEIWVADSYWGDDRRFPGLLCGWNISLTESLRYLLFRPNGPVPPYIYNSNGYPNYPEGVTDWPYGIRHPFYDGPRPYGALYRVHRDTGEFQLLHAFDDDDGASPRGPMVLAPDGQIYGTTLSGGSLRELRKGNGQLHKSRNGVLYRIDPARIDVQDDGQVNDGGFELVRDFVLSEEGNTPLGLALGSDDRLYGATLYGGQGYVGRNLVEHRYDQYGTVFAVDTEGTAAAGSVVMTVTPSVIRLGQTSELTWTGQGVRNCRASSNLADWNGDVDERGSIDLSPVGGTWYLSIACEDEATGRSLSSSSVLRVDMATEVEDDNQVSYGNGSGAVSLWVLGGLLLLAWRRLLPAPVRGVS